jgi:hypothetical protein
MTSEGDSAHRWPIVAAGCLQASEPFWGCMPYLRGALVCLHGRRCINHQQHGNGHWVLTNLELSQSDYTKLRLKTLQRLLQETEAFPLRLCLHWLAHQENMSPWYCQVLAGGWAAETCQLRHHLGSRSLR